MSKLLTDSISPDRLRELANGKIKPEDLNDEVFLIAYISGASGEIFKLTLLELAPILDELDQEGSYYIMLGYAMGQEDGSKQEIEFTFDPSDDNKKLH